jgi:sigma-B regulation protein RsbU (phosphoserine phosphatase)
MRYVKAAREPAILYRNDGATEVFDKGGPALGLLPSELLNKESYTEHSLTLHSGDTLFLYSDGLVEIENCKGKNLERKDIIQWGKDDLTLSPQEIADSIFRKIVSHAGGGDIVDDVSVLVIRKV